MPHSCYFDGCKFNISGSQHGVVWVCNYCGDTSTSLTHIAKKEIPAFWPIPLLAVGIFLGVWFLVQLITN